MRIRTILKHLPVVFVGALLITQVAQAKLKVIYGKDDRLDLVDVTDALHYDLAASTAAMMPASALKKNKNNDYDVVAGTLEDFGICKSEKFSDQPTAAYCSGFLVGEDLLVTAGHCIKNSSDCRKYKWVFDYNISDASGKVGPIAEESIYSCKSIVERKLERGAGADYALIKLNKKVTGKTPLKVRQSGKIANRASLVVIGHPTGLPTKVAAGANVRTNTKSTYFKANLDTFGGNSGSAVFDSKTGVVEGILVRGEQDYVRRGSCYVPKQCTDSGCMGEDVTRITQIQNL
jgi:hypothetical protein